MDGFADLTTAADADTVQVERAVFTSDRSPMGVGYRLVAASPGITRDEKREIVQCAPSHGSLCDDSPDAAALASFGLSSGRRCLLISRHAGVEQTGRGGYRVHTHVLVLAPEAFERFSCDPFSVERAALAEIGEGEFAIPRASLAPITLHFPADMTRIPVDISESSAEESGVLRLEWALAALLGRRMALIVGSPTPCALMELAIRLTPIARRRDLSASFGLKPSPARRFDLVLSEANPREIERITNDSDISAMCWNTTPTQAAGDYDVWLRFVRESIQQRRLPELTRIVDELKQDCSAELLAHVVRVAEAPVLVAAARATLLDELERDCLKAAASERTPGHLVDRLRDAVKKRRERLAEEAKQKAEEADQEAKDAVPAVQNTN